MLVKKVLAGILTAAMLFSSVSMEALADTENQKPDVTIAKTAQKAAAGSIKASETENLQCENHAYRELGSAAETGSSTVSGSSIITDGDIAGVFETVNPTDKTFTLTVSGSAVSYEFAYSGDAASKLGTFANGESIICKVQGGKVVNADKTSDVLQLNVAISPQGEPIIYKGGGYSPNYQKIKVNASCAVTSGYALDVLKEVDGIGIKADSITLSMKSELTGFCFKENGSQSAQLVPQTISPGAVCTYEYTVSAQAGAVTPAAVQAAIPINAAAEIDGKDVSCQQDIYVLNLDMQQAQAAEKKEAQAQQSGLSNARAELDVLCTGDILSMRQDMQNYLSGEQIYAMERYIFTWLAEISNVYQFTDDSSVRLEIMKKLGLDTAADFASGKAKAVTHMQAETKYGAKTIAIVLDIGSVKNQNDLSKAFGKLSYEILEKDGVPDGVPVKGQFGMADYDSMNQFAACVRNTADFSIRNEYESKLQTAELKAYFFVDKVIMNVVRNDLGSFSDGIYTIFKEPEADSLKKLTVACPVDVSVYSMDNQVWVPCGGIFGNTVSGTAVAMYTEGDAKVFYLTGNDYYVELNGTGQGSMAYTIDELGEGMERLRTVKFEALPLEDGTVYKGYILETPLIDRTLYSLESNNSSIYPDKDDYEPSFIKVTRVELKQPDKPLNKDGTLQLKADVYPADATNKNLQWSSDNESIAVVDSSGLVKAVGIGQAEITVTSMDGSYIKVSCVVTVTKVQNNNTPGGSTSGSAGGNSSGGSTGGSAGNPPSGTAPGSQLQVKLLYYIVGFNANGGTKLSRKEMTLLKDDSLGILPKVQRAGYIFKGWYKQESGGEMVSKSTVLNAAATLYAQWTAVPALEKAKTPTLTSTKSGQLKIGCKQIAGAAGYQIAYSTNKNFLAESTRKVTMTSASTTLKNLKKGKTYYVKVRAYVTDSTGKTTYGAYSTKKSIKVKA